MIRWDLLTSRDTWEDEVDREHQSPQVICSAMFAEEVKIKGAA
jgi:hypothetical protein